MENPAPADIPGDEVELRLDAGLQFEDPRPLQLETGSVTGYSGKLAEAVFLAGEQSSLWKAQSIWKHTIVARLREGGMDEKANILQDRHSTFTTVICQDCGRRHEFPNRCNNLICPECQPQIARARQDSIRWWTREIKQPKHVVLTVRNIPQLTAGHIHQAKHWLHNLRHRKFCDNWKSGCWSMEITNEGRGWHIHFHLLIDARWIDAPQLAREWCSVTDASGKIVKVRDARAEEYLAELVKYIAKGSQLATWPTADLLQFVTALDGVRTFGVFGDLYGLRTKYADWIKDVREKKPLCECGSSNVRYYSEAEALLLDAFPNQPQSTRPPPSAPDPQLTLQIPVAYQSPD
jgi:hypothetical protein